MAVSILITQCLQNDFVGAVEPHDPLPNKLHVGREEARRLLGPEPAAGPVAQLMSWAREQSPSALRVFHIRDWHDADDGSQQEHLAMFGPHCLRGTRGARLVLGLEDHLAGRPDERLVDASGLNDFEGTGLGEQIRAAARQAGGEPVRVGVVGVWTEAKVSFLLYDLKTRCGIDRLATCSALTASSSRLRHFAALEQLQRILGVEVFDSVGEFASWLLPEGSRPRPPRLPRYGPRLEIEGGPALSEDDRDILGFLYRDSSRVQLNALSGGFSGASVFRVRSRDANHEHAPSVAKLGDRKTIGKERAAFERLEPMLGNSAPSVRGFVDLGERAGIKYAFASMGGSVTSLKALYESGAPQARIDSVLRAVFEEVLGRLYAGAQYERIGLLDHYGFSPRFAPSVRKNVAAVAGEEAASRDRLSFPGGFEARNVVGFYEGFLAHPPPAHGEFHYVCEVHGDLNGANVLVDGRENVWVIDFFHAGPGHVLKDLAKVENDLLYIWTRLGSEAELEEALAITRALRAVKDLRAPLPVEPEGVRSEPLRRAWQTLRTLRALGASFCREDRDPVQLSVALLRYAAHTLSFDESSPLQKRWALAAACVNAEDVEAAAHAGRRLRIDWIEAAPALPGALGITLCPGRRDRARSLDEDLDALKAAGTSRLLCLLTEPEQEWAGVGELGPGCLRRGIAFRHLPVRDQSVPSRQEAAELSGWIGEALGRGDKVVVHCLGGLGRSGTVAACALVSRGLSAQEAIARVREARGPRAIETDEQARFVESFGR